MEDNHLKSKKKRSSVGRNESTLSFHTAPLHISLLAFIHHSTLPYTTPLPSLTTLLHSASLPSVIVSPHRFTAAQYPITPPITPFCLNAICYPITPPHLAPPITPLCPNAIRYPITPLRLTPCITPQGGWSYSSRWTNSYSLVLTGAAIYHRYWQHVYTQQAHPSLLSAVTTTGNCDDLLLNLLVAAVTRRPPIKLTQRKQYKDPTSEAK